MPTRDDLIRHYGTLPDHRLMALAAHEAAQLTPEALDVLRVEVHRRGLGDDLRAAIEIQTRRVAPAEEEELIDRFRRLPCPMCGSRAALLNAALVATAHSVLIMTTYEERLVIGCPRCIVAEARKANGVTARYAWWGLPWGPLRGAQAMAVNGHARSAAESTDATQELRRYVAANLGDVMVSLTKDSGAH